MTLSGIIGKLLYGYTYIILSCLRVSKIYYVDVVSVDGLQVVFIKMVLRNKDHINRYR